MPTLQFKGKSIIWNHHLSVPYHALESVPKLDYQPEKADGNLIIEGDNLLALKALLPLYGGKIKCIYIDPPYNTGNEGWVYNDNANSPLLPDWLCSVESHGRDASSTCNEMPRLTCLAKTCKPRLPKISARSSMPRTAPPQRLTWRRRL